MAQNFNQIQHSAVPMQVLAPTEKQLEAGYLRQSQLIPAILPFSSATLWRMVKKGQFPAPHKLSERVTAWRAEDVREYLADPAGYRTPEAKCAPTA